MDRTQTTQPISGNSQAPSSEQPSKEPQSIPQFQGFAAILGSGAILFDGYAGHEFALSDEKDYAVVAVKFRVDDPQRALEITQKLQKLTMKGWEVEKSVPDSAQEAKSGA